MLMLVVSVPAPASMRAARTLWGRRSANSSVERMSVLRFTTRNSSQPIRQTWSSLRSVERINCATSASTRSPTAWADRPHKRPI